jgi:hypothetical protein
MTVRARSQNRDNPVGTFESVNSNPWLNVSIYFGLKKF